MRLKAFGADITGKFIFCPRPPGSIDYLADHVD
jgi:hypothetical protein